jgi:hypothetical protein
MVSDAFDDDRDNVRWHVLLGLPLLLEHTLRWRDDSLWEISIAWPSMLSFSSACRPSAHMTAHMTARMNPPIRPCRYSWLSPLCHNDPRRGPNEMRTHPPRPCQVEL